MSSAYTDLANQITSEDPFNSLLYLTFNHPVAVLAEAIEKHGIQGWDRFGRFKSFTKDSPEAQSALDLLAREFQAQETARIQHRSEMLQEAISHRQRDPAFDWDSFRDQQPPLQYTSPLANELTSFGWLKTHAPDFDAITNSHQGQPQRTQETPSGPQSRRENNLMRVIGALLIFASGELTGRPHPHWRVQPHKAKRDPNEQTSQPCDPDDHLALRKWLNESFKAEKFGLEELKEVFDEAIKPAHKAREYRKALDQARSRSGETP